MNVLLCYRTENGLLETEKNYAQLLLMNFTVLAVQALPNNTNTDP